MEQESEEAIWSVELFASMATRLFVLLQFVDALFCGCARSVELVAPPMMFATPVATCADDRHHHPLTGFRKLASRPHLQSGSLAELEPISLSMVKAAQ